jgi:hypothetical protein
VQNPDSSLTKAYRDIATQVLAARDRARCRRF